MKISNILYGIKWINVMLASMMCLKRQTEHKWLSYLFVPVMTISLHQNKARKKEKLFEIFLIGALFHFSVHKCERSKVRWNNSIRFLSSQRQTFLELYQEFPTKSVTLFYFPTKPLFHGLDCLSYMILSYYC